MLRNRPRAVSSKQALMADHSSKSSPPQNYTSTSSRPIPSFFNSPRFKALITTTQILPAETDIAAVKSPTSILDSKPLFPFGYDINHPKSPKPFSKGSESKGIGLAIVNGKPPEEKSCTSENNKKVLFGTDQLRVQIPPILQPLISPSISPKSPSDFGIKTRNSRLFSSSSFGNSPRVFVPVKEMELSEEYTCVISHGPNPKTTHIFDNCVVEGNSNISVSNYNPKSALPKSFLSYCHTCKRNLEQRIDIYIYRGEKAFCSQECRYQEMLLDGEEN